MILTFLQSNFKNILLIGAVLFCIYGYNYVVDLKHENEINNLNDYWQKKEAETGYKEQIADAQDINWYLKNENKGLDDKLKNAGIKTSRIESILSQKLSYLDKQERSTNLQPVLDAINKKLPASMPFIDSTACLTVKGVVQFKDDSLKVKVLSRDFNNKSDIVGYWQRRQWSFLGIKTRFLGKKEVTAQSFSDCGEVRTVNIKKGK